MENIPALRTCHRAGHLYQLLFPIQFGKLDPGCVERANGTSRYEFYPFYEGPLTVAAINQKLAEYQTHYNTYRPHDGIGLLTPMEYYQQLIQIA